MMANLNNTLFNTNEKIVNTITKQNIQLNKNIINLRYKKKLQNINSRIKQASQTGSNYLIENLFIYFDLVEQVNENFLSNLLVF
jgi:hypothetical protein